MPLKRCLTNINSKVNVIFTIIVRSRLEVVTKSLVFYRSQEGRLGEFLCSSSSFPLHQKLINNVQRERTPRMHGNASIIESKYQHNFKWVLVHS